LTVSACTGLSAQATFSLQRTLYCCWSNNRKCKSHKKLDPTSYERYNRMSALTSSIITRLQCTCKEIKIQYKIKAYNTLTWLLGIWMYRISGSGWPDIRPFFESSSGSGSGQNGTRYWISQPDSARSFMAVS